ncbi:putative membrane protein YphA (DoxX/SURF4 family) [Microbacterium trichothecenolyticum]|nr:putative membrane protein YphA (DoxX/SURF4 family) [Microbacterium trichothecenolyticum]
MPTAASQSPTTPAVTTAPVRPSRRNGLGVAALVVGIAAFLTGLVPWLGLLLAIAAVALGVFALVKKQSKAFAVTGTVLGGVALIAGLIATIAFSAAIGTTSSAAASRQVENAAPAAPTAEPSTEPEVPAAEEPAAEEPAAPAAPAADGSVSHPFPQPYVAKGVFGGEKYSLTGRVVDANANALVEGWNQFNDDAPAGFKYVVVELTMTGIDPDGVEPSLAEWDLFLTTGEGNRYSNEYIVLDDGMPSMSDGPTLYPGNAFTGCAAYIVPDTAQAFMLYDNGNYISL